MRYILFLLMFVSQIYGQIFVVTKVPTLNIGDVTTDTHIQGTTETDSVLLTVLHRPVTVDSLTFSTNLSAYPSKILADTVINYGDSIYAWYLKDVSEVGDYVDKIYAHYNGKTDSTDVNYSVVYNTELIANNDTLNFGTVSEYTSLLLTLTNNSPNDIYVYSVTGLATPFGYSGSLGYVYAGSSKNITFYYDPQTDASNSDSATINYVTDVEYKSLGVVLTGIGTSTTADSGYIPYNLYAETIGNTITTFWQDSTSFDVDYIIEKSADGSTFVSWDSVSTLYSSGVFGYDTTQYFRVKSYNASSSLYSDWSDTLLVVVSELVASENPTAESTFESISLYWSPTGGSELNAGSIKYRKQGAALWRDGHELWYDPRDFTTLESGDGGTFSTNFDPEYRGSIVYCTAGTTYEIFTQMASGEWGYVEVDTWDETDNWTIIDTTFITDRTTPYIITDGGSASTGYKLYMSDPSGSIQTIDMNGAGSYYSGAVEVQASYVIVKDLKITDFKYNGVVQDDSVHHVLYDNLEIYEWGDRNQRHGRGMYFQDLDADSSTSLMTNIVIQNCTIRDSYTALDLWSPEAGDSYDDPGTISTENYAIAILFASNVRGGFVFRDNTITRSSSNTESWFRYGISSAGDFSFLGGFPKNCDFYRNYVTHSGSAFELDGGNRNVRVWDNFVTYVNYYSIAPVSMGPIYLFENVMDVAMTGEDESVTRGRSSMFKMGAKNDGGYWVGSGRTYIYHNLNLQTDKGNAYREGSTGMIGSVGGLIFNTVTRNNIMLRYRDHVSYRATAIYDLGTDKVWAYYNLTPTMRYSEPNDYNHDMLFGTISTFEDHPTYADNVYEPNGIFLTDYSQIIFEDSTVDYRLSSLSAGYDQGVVIPNFNDGYIGNAPDMGPDEPRTEWQDIITPQETISDTFIVSNGYDDTYAQSSSVNPQSVSLRIGKPSLNTATTGLIFSGITERSNLVSATLKVSSLGERSDTIKIKIYGYDSANPSAFDETYSDFSARVSFPTSANKTFTLTESWTDSTYYNFDVTNIINELFLNHNYTDGRIQLNIADNGSSTYHYRMIDADDNDRNASKLILSYGEVTNPPTITNVTASSITPTSATISGNVNPNGVSTTATIYIKHEDGVTYDSYVTTGINSTTNVSQSIDTLQVNTTYDYYMSAINSIATASSTTSSFTTLGGAQSTIEVSPSQSTDDVFFTSASASLTAEYLVLGNVSPYAYGNGVRFRGITIPSGATIDSAVITFTSRGDYSSADCDFIIYGEDTQSPVAYTSDMRTTSTRVLNVTTNSYTYNNVASWSNAQPYEFIVTDIVSELYGDYTYSSGDMSFWIKDNGSSTSHHRDARTWDYDSNNAFATDRKAKLKIWYSQ